MIIIEKKIIIQQPIDKVWNLLYGDFYKIDNWLSEVYHSKKETQKEVTYRVCKTPNGIIREKIIHVNIELYQFSYAVFGFPFFFKSITSSWQLNPVDSMTTEVTLISTIELLPIIAFIIKPIIYNRVNISLPKVLNDLKVFVETGESSERKLTYSQKYHS